MTIDPNTQIEQSEALRAVAVRINEVLATAGPADWEMGILVLRARKPEVDRVTGWIGVVWDTSGSNHAMTVPLSAKTLLTEYRAATLVEGQPRWESCLIEFHRSGRLRTQFEYEQPDRWWNGPDEKAEDYAIRMCPKFELPSTES